MTAAELFTTLTYPKNEHLIGGYDSFLSSDFVQQVQPADLPVALKWCESLGPRHNMPLSVERALDAVITRAWDFLDAPGVEDSFVQVVLNRLSQFEGLTEDRQASLFDTDAQKRLRVLEAAVRRLTKPEDAPILAQTHTPLAIGQDVPWLLGRLLAEASPAAQMAWAKLTWSVYNRHSSEHLDAIFEACMKCSVLAEVFTPLFQPVMLDSPDAQKARAFHREQSKWQQQLEERQRQNAPEAVLQRALAALAEYEAGNMRAWPIVTEAMTSDSSSGHPSLQNTDMTASPAWQQVEAETRPRFMQAAHSYVLTIDPDTPTAFSNAAGDEPVLAGYKALRLLFQTATDLLATLPSAVWARWAWVVLVYPLSSGYGDDEIPRALVSTAYQHAPAAVLLHLGRRVDEEDSQDRHIFVLARMRACWDERLSAFLLNKAREPKRSPGGLSTILDTLLAYGVTEAKTYAESLLTPPPETEDADPIALAMALLLMTHAQNESWPVIWTRMTQDIEFGRKLVESAAAAHSRQVEDLIRRLTEQQIADLYVWLVSQYPPTEDPVEYKFHQISPRESVGHWRNALVSQLAERGTRTSYEALRGLMERLPNSLQLRWLLLQAHRATLRSTWQQPSPEEILRLAADHETRLVRGGDELLAVLVDSLRRLQEELQGETPTAIFLWNEWPGGKYRPKTEEHFSDFVKVHLERDLRRRGVILNREVQIRRGQGGEPGERTDIHVDAVVKGPRVTNMDTVTVVIEAKGCWNTGLPDAMETQLVARYLKDNCEHGLYLIGWFNCNQWDPNDGRRGNSPQIDVAEAQKQFDQQARMLSRDGIQLRAVVLNTALR